MIHLEKLFGSTLDYSIESVSFKWQCVTVDVNDNFEVLYLSNYSLPNIVSIM